MNSTFDSLAQFVTLGVIVGIFSTARPFVLRVTTATLDFQRAAPEDANDHFEDGLLQEYDMFNNTQPASPPTIADLFPERLALAHSTALRSFPLENSVLDLSTPSICEFSARISSALATPGSARALLLSGLREQGWGALDGITKDALYFLGSFRKEKPNHDDERHYLHRLCCYIILDAICRHMGMINGPAFLDRVANDLAARFTRADHPGYPPSSVSSLFLGDPQAAARSIQFLISPLNSTIVPLVHTLTYQVETIDFVRDVFTSFAQNPTLAAYVHCTPTMPSVKQIVDTAAILHAAPPLQPSFRILTVTSRSPSWNDAPGLSYIRGLFDTIWEYCGTGGAAAAAAAQNVDLEAGLVLDADELRFISALLVATLIRFHN